MGLLDILNNGFDNSVGHLNELKDKFTSQPQMYDPHANAKALMGGQPMQYNQTVGNVPSLHPQDPLSLAAEKAKQEQQNSYMPTGMISEQVDTSIGPNMGQVNRFQGPTGMLGEQVDTTIGPNMGQINSTAPQGMLSPQVDTSIGPNMNANRPYNNSQFTPTDTMQSPYGSNPYPNQLGNVKESNLTQVNSVPFSWIKNILSPETLDKEELQRSGMIPNPADSASMSPFDNPDMMAAIAMQESSNRHTDANGKLITSPAGAVGKYQIMPSTAAQPGFGLKPLNLATATEADHEEFSRNYLNKLNERFGNQPDLTLAAYNYGVGNVEKLLKKHGVKWKEHLPKETKNYLKNFNML